MQYDYKKMYEKHTAFLQNRPALIKAYLALNIALTLAFFGAYVGLIAYVVFAKLGYSNVIRVLALPALCLFVVFVLRLAVDRPRPYSEKGAQITPLLVKKHKDGQSFPSRHTACAFVLATVALPYLPWLGAILFLFGCALAYIRFALGVHYPSDLIAGALVGLVCGILVFII